MSCSQACGWCGRFSEWWDMEQPERPADTPVDGLVAVLVVESSRPDWDIQPDTIRVFLSGEEIAQYPNWQAFLTADLSAGYTEAFIVRVIEGV